MIKVETVKKRNVETEDRLERWGNAVRDSHDLGLGARSILGVIRDRFVGGVVGLPMLPDDEVREIQRAVTRLGEFNPTMRFVIEQHYVERVSLSKLARKADATRDALIEIHDAAVWWIAGDLSRGTLIA